MKFEQENRLIGKTEVTICFNGDFYQAKVTKNPRVSAIGKTMDEVITNIDNLMKKQAA